MVFFHAFFILNCLDFFCNWYKTMCQNSLFFTINYCIPFIKDIFSQNWSVLVVRPWQGPGECAQTVQEDRNCRLSTLYVLICMRHIMACSSKETVLSTLHNLPFSLQNTSDIGLCKCFVSFLILTKGRVLYSKWIWLFQHLFRWWIVCFTCSIDYFSNTVHLSTCILCFER